MQFRPFAQRQHRLRTTRLQVDSETPGAAECPQFGAVFDAGRVKHSKYQSAVGIVHGHFDLSAYEAYLARELEDYEYPEEKVAASLEALPLIT